MPDNADVKWMNKGKKKNTKYNWNKMKLWQGTKQLLSWFMAVAGVMNVMKLLMKFKCSTGVVNT